MLLPRHMRHDMQRALRLHGCVTLLIRQRFDDAVAGMAAPPPLSVP